MLRRAKCRDKHGRDMRYEAEWLLESFLLSIKSPTTYEHIRAAGILPLPCRETLRELMSSMSCHFGFNDLALDAIEKALEGKGPNDCFGSLMWDEIATTQDVMFNTQSFQFDGFVETDEEDLNINVDEEGEDDTHIVTNEEVTVSDKGDVTISQCADDAEASLKKTKKAPKKSAPRKIFKKKGKKNQKKSRKRRNNDHEKETSSENEVEDQEKQPSEQEPKNIFNQTVPKLANHALVFAFRPYMSNWIQPFGVFSGHNAISGPKLYRLVHKALILLNARGARVLSTVCDGASNNCTVWKMFKISGRNTDTEVMNHAIEHPTTKEPVYFLRDAPHLIKCIRNHLVTHKDVQV